MRLSPYLAVLLVFSARGTASADDAAKPQSGLKLVVVQIEPDAGEAGPVVRVIAENRTSVMLTVVRPRSWWIRSGGANGWTLTMKGPGGEYQPLIPPGPAPILGPADLLEIAPGDGFSMRLNLSEWRVREGDNFKLFGTPGEYQVQAGWESPKSYYDQHARAVPIRQHVTVLSEALKISVPR